MTDIFLSYARKDVLIAQRLARALEDEGWSVWWDNRIPTGGVFYEVITKKVAASRCVVVLWSKNSVESKWVNAEANEGWMRGILIPAALITNMEILPLPFKVAQTASLVGWRGEKAHQGYQSLVDAISALVGQPRPIQPKPQPQARRQCQAHSQPRSSSAFPIPKWKIALTAPRRFWKRYAKWTIAVVAFSMVVGIGFLALVRLSETPIITDSGPALPPLPMQPLPKKKVIIQDYGNKHYQLYRGNVLLGTTPYEFEATVGESIQVECRTNNKHVQTLAFAVSNNNVWACRE